MLTNRLVVVVALFGVVACTSPASLASPASPAYSRTGPSSGPPTATAPVTSNRPSPSVTPLATATPLPTTDPATARAAALFEAVGVTATRYETHRAVDTFSGLLIDTTHALDRDDGMIATLDYDVAAGRLRTFNRYGSWESTGPDATTAAQATSLGIDSLRSLGLDQPAAQPPVAWDDSMDAWLLNWPRVLDGVPVPANALRVWIDGDGWLRAASLLETANLPAPASPISPSAARRSARHYLDRTPLGRKAVLARPHLEWRTPNDFIDQKPVPAGTPLRLVYAIDYTIALADRQELGVLWVDASNGSLVGGDEVD